jgi:hypothetical protein
MQDLDNDIKAFNEIREELEKNFTGKWILIYDQKLISAFDSFEDAAKVAVENFGNGPYLIRQVGARPIVLPSSLLFNIGNA